MNKIALIALFAGLGLSTSAMAADLGVINTVAPAAFDAPVYDWTGFYAGVNLGYGWANIEQGGFTLDGEGVIGGAQVGYNYDFGGFVLGAEADFQLSDVNHEDEIIPGVTLRSALDSFGTVRARAGIAMDRFLPYATAGLAWGNASISANALGGFPGFEFDDTYVGWTIGAGLEYAVSDNISVKAEYLYTDFGTADFGVPGGDIKLTTNTARVGLNYQF